MTLQKTAAPLPAKAVLVISSHVMAGTVGNRAAAFALERMGHPVWEIPTIVLPWHPGHGPATRQVPDPLLFSQSLEDLTQHPDFSSLGAVLTGYLGEASQAAPIAKLVDKLKAANPEALYVCDPVMGEETGLYIPQQTAEAMRDILLPRADIITPNRFEWNWLTQSAASDNMELVKAAQSLDIPKAIITSAFPMLRNSIGNLLVQKAEGDKIPQAILCEHQAIPTPPNGTGDLFAALYLGHQLAGHSDEQSLKLASSGIFEVVSRTRQLEEKDLNLAAFQDRFIRPMAMVNLRSLSTGPKTTPFRKGPKRQPKS